MNKVEQLIDEQYKELADKFRPIFRNLKHIQISQDIGKLGKLEKKFEKKLEASHDLKKIRDEVRQLKRQILYNLKMEVA